VVNRQSTFGPRRASGGRRGSAFSLAELLVVIGIIVVLVGILIPTVSRVRLSAQEADTRALIAALDGAIQRYYQDFRGYPGPIPDRLIRNAQASDNSFAAGQSVVGRVPTGIDGFETNLGDFVTKVTGAENLVLGLLGGLRWESYGAGGGGDLIYDPSTVGQGPLSLNTANPKRTSAYLDTKDLSWRVENGRKTGRFRDDAGLADDTLVPEFVDRFAAGPLPILYLRAKAGAGRQANPVPPLQPEANNGVINIAAVNRASPTSGYGNQQYDLDAIIGYTDSTIGTNKSPRRRDYTTGTTYPEHGLKTVDVNSSLDNPPPSGRTFRFPYDAYAYLLDPNQPHTPRKKNEYILISPGRDRVYGTSDDITNFGPVK
jgi:type II secretory pathway pseudopilin PulG